VTAPITLTVIGGYLGAGKTTLVNHILRSATGRTAVLINDFGAISIDEDLIVAADDDTITLANGCICCSLVDGFAAALHKLRSLDDPPSRLVIEASGVSDPEQIAAYGHVPGLRLDAVISVADAETVRSNARDRYVGDIVIRQLTAADVIVVNKVDLVSDSALQETRRWLHSVAPAAAIVEAVQARLPMAAVVDVGGPERVAASGSDDHGGHIGHAEDRFETWCYATSAPLDRGRLEAALAGLPTMVIRVKGIVRVADEPETRLVVHRVGQRQTIEDAGPWTGGDSRLVVIGQRGALNPTWLRDRMERTETM
jgi:G3E family GTPase